jgi:hypothetical protein
VTLQNIVICDMCGDRVNPPENRGWAVLFKIGDDGVNVAECDGHLCRACRLKFFNWVQQMKETLAKAKAALTGGPKPS